MRARFTIATAAMVFSVAGAGAEVPSAVAPGHVPEPTGLYQGAMHGYTPNTVTGGTVIDTAQLAKLIKTQRPVLLDVAEKDRKPPSMDKDTPWFPIHRSVPGADFLEGGGSGTSDPAFAHAFKARVAELTGDNKNRPVVTFCHPDCWGSYNAAKRLVGLGYTHVYWDRDGVEGWEADAPAQTVTPDRTWLASLPATATQ